MSKIESLESIALGLTLLVPLLTLLLPLFKDFISSTISRVIKERSAIEKLSLDLDSLVSKRKYIQDINILNSRTLRGIPFENVNILLRKNISLIHLIEVSDISKKNLCTYKPITGEIVLVSESEYEVVKRKDKVLYFYFVSFILSITIYVLNTLFFQEIITMVLFFVLTMFFELVWLLRKISYDSYIELIKNENILRDQGITVAQDITR